MAEHRIVISTPPREIGNVDTVIDISADGEKLGELHLSRGGVDWWPRDAKRHIPLTWKQFRDRLERD